MRRREPALDPLLRAAIGHIWFVTQHPLDDGNGRIARALTDLALAQGERQSIGFYALSAAILADRAGSPAARTGAENRCRRAGAGPHAVAAMLACSNCREAAATRASGSAGRTRAALAAATGLRGPDSR